MLCIVNKALQKVAVGSKQRVGMYMSAGWLSIALLRVFLGISLTLVSFLPVLAQVPSTTIVPTSKQITPLILQYGRPTPFPVGSMQSYIFGDFKCSSDGSVYVPMSDPAADIKQAQSGRPVNPSMIVVGLQPSGEAVRILPVPIDGYVNVMSFFRYYITASEVYLLVTGDRVDTQDSKTIVGRSRFLQVFDHKGEHLRTVTLPPDANPLTFATFSSGEILLFEVDRLNHNTRVTLLDANGRYESELKLFDADLAQQPGVAAKHQESTSILASGTDLFAMLSTASIIPRKDDLLFMASGVNYPVLELNQHGLVRTIPLAVPPGKVPYSLLPSTDDLLHAVVGEMRSPRVSGTEATIAAEKTAPHGFFSTEIDDFYPTEGSLFRAVALESGPLPTCVGDGEYIFLVPRGDDGKLQVIHATLSLK